MTVSDLKESCDLKIKLITGANIVKVKPLFTYQSRHIVVAAGEAVKVYSIQSGLCIHTLRHHQTSIVSLQYNRANKLQFFSCSEDGAVVRWDYTEGKLLQVYCLNQRVELFFAPSASLSWFIVSAKDNKFELYSVNFKEAKKCDKSHILGNVLPSENAVSFGFNMEFIAAICGKFLSVYLVDKKEEIRHSYGKYTFTCVEAHPSDYCVATGDSNGRIIVWSNLLHKKPIHSVYHWHTLPVADLAFSTEGCYIQSGGGEACLVKWNLFSQQKPHVLPRLGAPIRRIVNSPDNSLILIAQDDNSIQILNPQCNVVQVIQGLNQSHFSGSKDSVPLPAGLMYDAMSKAVVLNGKIGHLQFYDVHEDKQLFNLDIVGRSIATQERDKVIVNIDVHKAAMDKSGSWLATAECWNDEEASLQMWLKFWMFDIEKQTYTLNTNVILPHNKELNCIVFSPVVESSDVPTAVTTSNDGKFKVWALSEEDTSGKQSWSCESMGSYRNMVAGDASFSEEGSLLAVAFGNVVTLWATDNTKLKAVLHHKKIVDDIQQVIFGTHSCSHYLVTQNRDMIIVWNLLSLSIKWIVYASVHTIVNDPTSDIFAAFCNDSDLIMFKPDSPHPLYSKDSVSDKPIIAAIFVPRRKSKTPKHSSCLLKKSQLFFFNADQKFLTLTDEKDEEITESIKIQQNIPKTPFGMLQAEKTVTSVEEKPTENLHIHSFQNKDHFEYVSPTLADPMALCTHLLRRLLVPLTSELNINDTNIKTEEMEIEEKLSGKISPNSHESTEADLGNYEPVDFSFLKTMVNLPL